MSTAECGQEVMIVVAADPQQAGEINNSRQRKEERRRERRERRNRRLRQRQTELVNQLDAFMYEGAGQQAGPPPPYTTLPPAYRAREERRGWRAALPAFYRRAGGDMQGEAFLMERTGKSCCGVPVSQTVSIRWFIVMIAFVGICCAIVGTVLGAMKASGREHLTVSLLMIGVGIVLITVSGIAWRLTSQDAPSCRAMLGLSTYTECGDARFLSRPGGAAFGPPRGGNTAAPSHHHHPYSGMLYSEFQYRPPPPSYQASMQEYRLRLLLMDRNNPPPPPPPGVTGGVPALLSPPPAYRGPRPSLLAPVHNSDISRPPSYRSRSSDHHNQHLAILHGRHPSQLSYLSQVLAEEQEEPKAGIEQQQQQHASVVPVIPVAPPLLHKASIRIGETSGEKPHYITNLQEQFTRDEALTLSADGKKGGGGTAATGDRVTIVQNNPTSYHPLPLGRPAGGVVVTVSAGVSALCETSSQRSSPEVDILAHL